MSRVNEFKPLPSDRPNDFDPKSIVHVVLSVSMDGPKVKFGLRPVYNSANPADIEDYVLGLANKSNFEALLSDPKTPYDIHITESSWIVVELDDNQNWHFTPDELGFTTKKEYGSKYFPNDDNFGLRHIYKDGRNRPGNVEDDSCKILYFGVVRRDKYESQQFNLKVDFVQIDVDQLGNNVKKTLKIIFDPDIKNDGDGFPGG